jgi:plastocyanin
MKATMTRWLWAGVLAAALAVTGCGSTAPARSGTAGGSPGAAHNASAQLVTIEGTNALRFAPMTVHVRPGTVRVTLKDMGAYPHNIVIPGLKVTSPTVTGDPGGMTVRFTVTFTRHGSFPFHCQYHASSGMTGVFVVS